MRLGRLRVGHLEVARQCQDRGLARVIALSAHTRVLMATGDLASVEERMRHLHHATQLARTPLRLTRMRLLLCDVYRRAGKTDGGRTRARVSSACADCGPAAAA